MNNGAVSRADAARQIDVVRIALPDDFFLCQDFGGVFGPREYRREPTLRPPAGSLLQDIETATDQRLFFLPRRHLSKQQVLRVAVRGNVMMTVTATASFLPLGQDAK